MQSKNSLLNKALIKKDLTRFWPVWAIETVVLLFFDLLFLNELGHSSGNYLVETAFTAWGIFAVFFSILAASMVFGYLSDRKEAYMVHSFPISRKVLFWSHYVSGFLMVMVPLFLSWLICMLRLSAAVSCSALHLLLLLFQFVLAGFYCYNLACFSMLITANRISSWVIYPVLNALVYAVSTICSVIQEFMVYGIDATVWNKELSGIPDFIYTVFTPFDVWRKTMVVSELYDSGKTNLIFSGHWLSGDLRRIEVVFAAVPAFFFLFACYQLFIKRKIESAGDMVAFSWAKPVYKAVFVFFFSVLNVILILFVTGDTGEPYYVRHPFVIGVIFSAVLGYLVVTMIMERKFSIWHTLTPIRVLAPPVCMGFVIVLLTWIGNVGMALPEIRDISSVQVDGITEYNKGGNIIYLSKQAEIKTLLKLNDALIEDAKEQGRSEDGFYFSIIYNLKDRRSVSKDYWVPRRLKSVQELRKFCIEEHYIDRIFYGGKVKFTSFRIEDDPEIDGDGDSEIGEILYHAGDDEEGLNSGTMKEAEELYQAILEDEKNGKWLLSDEEINKCRYRLDMGFSADDPNVFLGGEQYIALCVPNENVHTIQVIERLLAKK